jgi:hypothetical protein
LASWKSCSWTCKKLPLSHVLPLFTCIDHMKSWSSISCGIACFASYIFVFVKTSRWWGVTRSTQPHVHTYMSCPYVISTLYCLVEEYKWELSKDTFFFCILLTTLHLREMN